MGRLKHGSASLPTPLVLVLCLACFLGGHFLLPRLVDSSVRCSVRTVSGSALCLPGSGDALALTFRIFPGRNEPAVQIAASGGISTCAWETLATPTKISCVGRLDEGRPLIDGG